MPTATPDASTPFDASALVSAVCVVHQILPDPGNDPDTTAIDKRPVAGRREVGELGVRGDTQCDRRDHGGPFQAVYAYADEDAEWWASVLSREITPGLFGENLRLRGVDVTGAEIGERWQVGVGEAPLVVEVTMPRVPCTTFQVRMGEPHWMRRFTEHGAPGAYLRVVQTGTVAAGDPVVVVHRPGHGVTVGQAFLRPDPETMQRLLDAAEAGRVTLTAKMADRAAKAVARL